MGRGDTRLREHGCGWRVSAERHVHCRLPVGDAACMARAAAALRAMWACGACGACILTFGLDGEQSNQRSVAAFAAAPALSLRAPVVASQSSFVNALT